MKITELNLRAHEMIGLYVKIVRSRNRALTGLEGLVVDETMNTLIISDHKRKRTVPKDTASFRFMMSDGSIIELEGSEILGRPQDRILRLR